MVLERRGPSSWAARQFSSIISLYSRKLRSQTFQAQCLSPLNSVCPSQISKRDWAVWAASLAGTVAAGAQVGLAISITLALLFVIYESATPNVVQLGRLPGTKVYRSSPHHPTTNTTHEGDTEAMSCTDAPLLHEMTVHFACAPCASARGNSRLNLHQADPHGHHALSRIAAPQK